MELELVGRCLNCNKEVYFLLNDLCIECDKSE